jgi:hypothetical protein
VKTFRRHVALGLFVVLLLAWPLTFRYTSFGIDSEQMIGQSVFGRYYRVRWPGNGSLMIGYVDEHHHFRGKAADAFDLGGTFLQPAKPPRPRSVANWLGFWWIDVDHEFGQDDPALSGATKALLVGVPHWGFVVISGFFALRSRSSRRTAQTRA